MAHQGPAYFISTGEPSGDLLAAELVSALGQLRPEWQPHGVVGPALRDGGVREVAGIEELSVMGFWDVLGAFASIKTLEDRLVAYIERLDPLFVVLTDYPGFHFHLAERLKGLGFTVYLFVAPQLWAWGAKRVRKLRDRFDGVFGILPFEEAWFRQRGVVCHYVGTPQVGRVAAADFPHEALPAGRKLGLFPGSRRGEVARIWPRLAAAAAIVKDRHPETQIIVSLAGSLDAAWFVSTILGPEGASARGLDLAPLAKPGGILEWQPGWFVVRGESVALMKQVTAACVTSGTATLECALALTPMAVIYLAGAFTYAIGKRLVKLPHISLANLVAGKGAVKEFVQEFTDEALADELAALLVDAGYRDALRQELSLLDSKLKRGPGLHLAQILVDKH